MLKYFLLLILTTGCCWGFGEFHMKKYTPRLDSSEEDNSVLSELRELIVGYIFQKDFF